jgi:hypothetical protein
MHCLKDVKNMKGRHSVTPSLPMEETGELM